MEFIMETEKQQKADVISQLRKQIQSLEGYKQTRSGYIGTGISAIDHSLPGGSFPLAAIHEFIATSAEDAAATSGFLSALLSGVAAETGTIVWIVKDLNLFPPSLKIFGLDPSRIIFIALPKPQEALWAMEEALKCKELAAVIGEIADPDLTATRRLQIATEKSGVPGFLLRMNPRKSGSTACVTRWSVKPLPSGMDDHCPGVGFPRWQLELIKVKNGQPGTWPVEWRSNAFHLVVPERKAEQRLSRFKAAG
jgi:protein ImuA